MPLKSPLNAKGTLKVIARDVHTGEIVSESTHTNTILSAWFEQLASDLANGTNDAQPVIMAFSASVVASSPEPTELTSEFRDEVTLFASSNQLNMICVLSASEGNTVSPIKSCGFYFGADATTVAGTGTLGSIINTLNQTKNSSIELTFQYTIEFSAA